MTSNYYQISFDFDGTHYEGRITPEAKGGHHHPSSWHVVLNEVFFGYVHQQDEHWQVSEQRPAALVTAVGRQIEKAVKTQQPLEA